VRIREGDRLEIHAFLVIFFVVAERLDHVRERP